MANKFCNVAPNNCGPSVRNLLYINIWYLEFEVASAILENCVPLSYTRVPTYLSDFVLFTTLGFLPYTLFYTNTNSSSCFSVLLS
jgi:hypothetical protein